jgi:uncharacterized integral membrane protein (TIGR00698 family)
VLNLLPGVALALMIAIVSMASAQFLGTAMLGLPSGLVSPILIAILLGIGVRNCTRIPVSCESGVGFALGNILKVGVALLGIRLSLDAVAEIGLLAAPIVGASIVTALVVVQGLARWVGLAPRLGTLIAVGTSICGVTAIAAVAPCIRARDGEVSYAIACIALFGLMSMLAYPFIADRLFAGSEIHIGLFLGTAIHDTAQVIGAGLLFEQLHPQSQALEIATVTKLLRNLCMLLVIPCMTVAYARHARSAGAAAEGPARSLLGAVPLFIIGFVAMSLVRTCGDLWFDVPAWPMFVDGLQQVSQVCLTVAMAAVGLGTRFSAIRTLGMKPLVVGFAAAATVGVVSLSLIRLLVPGSA